MKVYVVIELSDAEPKIIGVFSTKAKAEKIAYAPNRKWCNILEKTIDKAE